jgi:hypothetical protein
MIFFLRLIGNSDEDFSGGLLVVPAGFDCGKLSRLPLVNIITIQVPQEQLNRNENRRKKQSHSQHQHAFCCELAVQAVPCAGSRDTEGARQIGGDEHMWKADPYDRTEDDRLPIGWDKNAVLDDVAYRRLHPAVVDHDPERTEGRAERYHHGGKEVDQGRHAVSSRDQHAEE